MLLSKNLRGRLFPDRWSVWLGRVAFSSFVVVMISGVFLLFHYDQSTDVVRYDGPYLPLAGTEMSQALASTLKISFEVRGGLLMRQVHHWGTLVMAAAIMLHLLHVFFTGAYRGEHKVRWLVVVGLLVTTMAAGFTGAVLPDDLLSGTSLAIFDGVLKSTPFIGTWLSYVLFGGSAIERLYPLHVYVLPVVMVGLFVVSGMLGRGRRSRAALVKSGGFFLMVSGVLLVMAATATINPIWLYGPADPASGSAGASPEWYLAFLDGALRLVPPGWEFVWLGRTWSVAVLLPVIAGSMFFVVVTAYPFIEARFKPGSKFLERPRDNPTRTGIGVAGMIFYGVLWMAASADTIAVRFHVTFEGVLHTFQVLVLLGPVIGFLVTRSLCQALRDREREIAEDGAETGVIIRTADGGYREITRRLPLEPARRSALLDRGAEPAKDPVGVGSERVVVD